VKWRLGGSDFNAKLSPFAAVLFASISAFRSRRTLFISEVSESAPARESRKKNTNERRMLSSFSRLTPSSSVTSALAAEF